MYLKTNYYQNKTPNIIVLLATLSFALLGYVTAYSDVQAMIIVKSLATLLLLLFSIYFKSRRGRLIYALALICGMILTLPQFSISELSENKSLGYLIFNIIIFLMPIIRPSKKQLNWILIISMLVMLIVGARGPLLALMIAIFVFRTPLQKYSIFVAIGFIFFYSAAQFLASNFEFQSMLAGKSENDRALMNYYFVNEIIKNPFLPTPSLMENNNILEQANTEGIYVHNFWLVSWAYLGVAVLPMLIILLGKIRKSTSDFKELAYAIIILLSLSPESNIARYLIFALPSLINRPIYLRKPNLSKKLRYFGRIKQCQSRGSVDA